MVREHVGGTVSDRRNRAESGVAGDRATARRVVGTVGGHTRRASLIAVAMACVALGCTMCPDPFDYSGPVPDGSSPQNDFHARAGGILPLGHSPIPWPPVVDGGELPPSVLVAEATANDGEVPVDASESDTSPEAPEPEPILR